MTYQTV